MKSATKYFSLILLISLSLLILNSCEKDKNRISIFPNVPEIEINSFNEYIIETDNYYIKSNLGVTGYSPVTNNNVMEMTLMSKGQDRTIDIAIISDAEFNIGSKVKLYTETNIYKTVKSEYVCTSNKYGWKQLGKIAYCNLTYYDNVTDTYIEYEDIIEISSDYSFKINPNNATISWNNTILDSIDKSWTDITNKFNHVSRETLYGNEIYYVRDVTFKSDKEYHTQFHINVNDEYLPLKYSICFGNIEDRQIYFCLDPTIINSKTWTIDGDWNQTLTNLTTINNQLELATYDYLFNFGTTQDNNMVLAGDGNNVEFENAQSFNESTSLRIKGVSAYVHTLTGSPIALYGGLRTALANTDIYNNSIATESVTAPGFNNFTFPETYITTANNIYYAVFHVNRIAQAQNVNYRGYADTDVYAGGSRWFSQGFTSWSQSATLDVTSSLILEGLRSIGIYSDRQSWSPQTGNIFTNMTFIVITSASGSVQFRYNTTNSSLDTSEWVTLSVNGTNVVDLDVSTNDAIYYQIKLTGDGIESPKVTSYTLYEESQAVEQCEITNFDWYNPSINGNHSNSTNELYQVNITLANTPCNINFSYDPLITEWNSPDTALTYYTKFLSTQTAKLFDYGNSTNNNTFALTSGSPNITAGLYDGSYGLKWDVTGFYYTTENAFEGDFGGGSMMEISFVVEFAGRTGESTIFSADNNDIRVKTNNNNAQSDNRVEIVFDIATSTTCSWSQFTYDYPLEPLTKYNITLFYDGSKCGLYVNGLSIYNDTTVSGNVPAITSYVRIGQDNSVTMKNTTLYCLGFWSNSTLTNNARSDFFDDCWGGVTAGSPEPELNLSKGLIKSCPASPFCTEESNPFNLTFIQDGSYIINLTVNATGEIGSTWGFFVDAESIDNTSISATTSTINITIDGNITEEPEEVLPSWDIQWYSPTTNANHTNNSNVIYQANVTIYNGAVNLNFTLDPPEQSTKILLVYDLGGAGMTTNCNPTAGGGQEASAWNYMKNNSHKNFSCYVAIDDDNAYANYTAFQTEYEAGAFGVMVIFSSVNSGSNSFKWRNLTYPVIVLGDSALNIGMCAGDDVQAGESNINITNNTHPSMTHYATTGVTVYGSSTTAIGCTSPGSGIDILAQRPSSSTIYFGIYENQSLMVSNYPAPARRVWSAARTETWDAYNANTTLSIIKLIDWMSYGFETTTELKSGAIPACPDSPFCTELTHPFNLTLDTGSHIINLTVNATGEVGTTHDFFWIATQYDNSVRTNQTDVIEIKITAEDVEEEDVITKISSAVTTILMVTG